MYGTVFCFKSVVQDIIVLTQKLKENLDSTYENFVSNQFCIENESMKHNVLPFLHTREKEKQGDF